jgi:hypothetical protein
VSLLLPEGARSQAVSFPHLSLFLDTFFPASYNRLFAI